MNALRITPSATAPAQSRARGPVTQRYIGTGVGGRTSETNPAKLEKRPGYETGAGLSQDARTAATNSRSRLTGKSKRYPCWPSGSGEPGPTPNRIRPGATSARAAHVMAVRTAPRVNTLIAALPRRTFSVAIARAVRAVTESRVMRVSACQSESNPACSAALPSSTSERRSGPPKKPRPSFIRFGRRAGTMSAPVPLCRCLCLRVPFARHEEHGRRAQRPDQLSVMPCVAGHTAPANTRLFARGLNCPADVTVEADACLVDDLTELDAETSAAAHVPNQLAELMVEAVKRFIIRMSEVDCEVSLTRYLVEPARSDHECAYCRHCRSACLLGQPLYTNHDLAHPG